MNLTELIGTGGIFTAIATIAVATINYIANKKIEHIKGDLSRQLEAFKKEQEVGTAAAIGETAARRVYEFEARKRLYTDVEPLLFRLSESCELSLKRIRSIARSRRTNELGTWLGGDYSTYYLTSVMYRMLLPCAILQIIRRKITTVDLSLDQRISDQYTLARILYYSWTADFDLAAGGTKASGIGSRVIDYSPNDKNWQTQRTVDPPRYWRQGLPLGRLDQAVDLLIKSDPDEPDRPITYGEFVEAYESRRSNAGRFFRQYLWDLLQDFSPETRPVLWRIMVTQAILAKAIVTVHGSSTTKGDVDRREPLASIVTRAIAKLRHDRDYRYFPTANDVDGSVALEYVGECEDHNKAFDAADEYIMSFLNNQK